MKLKLFALIRPILHDINIFDKHETIIFLVTLFSEIRVFIKPNRLSIMQTK
jgi:hypothetical protein